MTRHRRSAGGWTPTGPAVPEPPADGRPGRERGEGLSEHGATAGPRGGTPHRQLDVAGEARGLPAAGGGQGTHLGLPGTAPPPAGHTGTKISRLRPGRQSRGRCRVSAEALSPRQGTPETLPWGLTALGQHSTGPRCPDPSWPRSGGGCRFGSSSEKKRQRPLRASPDKGGRPAPQLQQATS